MAEPYKITTRYAIGARAWLAIKWRERRAARPWTPIHAFPFVRTGMPEERDEH